MVYYLGLVSGPLPEHGKDEQCEDDSWWFVFSEWQRYLVHTTYNPEVYSGFIEKQCWVEKHYVG